MANGLASSNDAAEQSFSGGSTTDPVLPCQKKCWIELELIDQDGKPVGDEVYWLKTQGGTFKKGRLDAKGQARVESIDCGTCDVRFPNLDDDDWVLDSSTGMDASTGAAAKPEDWIEIELLDEAGKPVAGKFELTDANGATQTLTLDGNGFARVEKLPAGMCSVRFADLDKRDFLR